MTEQDIKAFNAFFDEIYQGNVEARELSMEILHLVHIWDDLYDRDKDVTNAQVNRAFFSALITLSKNELYQRCNLTEHMLGIIFRWKAANFLEENTQSDDDLNKAYMLRAGIYDLFTIIAFYLHGDQWAEAIAPAVYRFYGEKLDDFKKEVAENA